MNNMKKLLLLLIMTYAVNAQTVKKITFSGGAPLDSFQAKTIIPLLKEAFKRENIEFEAKYFPSLRSLAKSNKGITDGELYRIYNFAKVTNNKYKNLIRIESKLLSFHICAFSNKDLNITKWEDLKDYKVAYVRGKKNAQKNLQRFLRKDKIIKVSDAKQSFEMLRYKRVDIVISDREFFDKLNKNDTRFASIKEVGELGEVKMYSYMNKKYKELAVKIANRLDEMKKDGTYINILNKARSIND